MPAYSSALPPSSLWPGAVGSSFSNEAVPASAQAGAQFALIEPGGFPQEGRTVAWQTLFTTAPTAISVSLQGAMADQDSQYATLDTSTNVAGEQRTVANVRARFLRCRVNSSTVGSGAGFTAQILP